jgi:hypothetical protein
MDEKRKKLVEELFKEILERGSRDREKEVVTHGGGLEV